MNVCQLEGNYVKSLEQDRKKKTLPESKKVNLIVFECRIVAIRFLPEIVKVRHSETN